GATLPLVYLQSPTTAIYPLSLHDALPIYQSKREPAEADCQERCGAADIEPWQNKVRDGDDWRRQQQAAHDKTCGRAEHRNEDGLDRKSTRLNSSHVKISYAVFCSKQKATK